MRHFLPAVDQQGARIALCKPQHALGNGGGQAADEVASADMGTAHPEARPHFTAAWDRADMVGQIANVDGRIPKAEARTNDCRLLVIIQPRVGKTKTGRRHEADRAAYQIATDIFVDD